LAQTAEEKSKNASKPVAQFLRARRINLPQAELSYWSIPRIIMGDNRMGEQVSKVGNDAKNGIATAVETVTDLTGKAQTAAVEAAGTIRDAAVETAERVGDATTSTYRQGVRAGEYVSQNTAEQPLLALLIAGAIGYGIAYMIHGHK
jgi:hypothetical protein